MANPSPSPTLSTSPLAEQTSHKPGSLIERFQTICEAQGLKPAIEDEREVVSFKELARRVDSISLGLNNALRELSNAAPASGGAPKRVALLATQGSVWVEGLFAILSAGHIAVPLSHLHPAPEQRWFVETSGAELVLISSDQRAELEARQIPVHSAARILSIEPLRGQASPGEASQENQAQGLSLAPSAKEHGPGSHISPENYTPQGEAAPDQQPALILFTSGTTGKPKGALISQHNLAATAELLGRAWRWSAADRLLHCLPLHHLHGLGISLLVSILHGSTTRMLTKFDAEKIWSGLGEVSVLMGVPTMHKKLLDALDAAPQKERLRWERNASELRLVTSGSAALPTTIGKRWQLLTGNYPLERFGMTEIGVGATNPVDGPRKPGTCGRPLPGMELRIVNEQGLDSPPGEPGEIWVRGPGVFLGYDQNERATQEAFQDGWFRSGDTAVWDEDGYCKILGRTSVDILKSGGYKISALEIEELFREHPAVRDVAVVGVPDETWGELVVAVIILSAGSEARGGAVAPDEAELRSWAKHTIASYKVPKRVLFVEDFPRNPVGKVIKPELRSWVQRTLLAEAASAPAEEPLQSSASVRGLPSQTS